MMKPWNENKSQQEHSFFCFYLHKTFKQLMEEVVQLYSPARETGLQGIVLCTQGLFVNTCCGSSTQCGLPQFSWAQASLYRSWAPSETQFYLRSTSYPAY